MLLRSWKQLLTFIPLLERSGRKLVLLLSVRRRISTRGKYLEPLCITYALLFHHFSPGLVGANNELRARVVVGANSASCTVPASPVRKSLSDEFDTSLKFCLLQLLEALC